MLGLQLFDVTKTLQFDWALVFECGRTTCCSDLFPRPRIMHDNAYISMETAYISMETAYISMETAWTLKSINMAYQMHLSLPLHHFPLLPLSHQNVCSSDKVQTRHMTC